jgi:hypothetical protein
MRRHVGRVESNCFCRRVSGIQRYRLPEFRIGAGEIAFPCELIGQRWVCRWECTVKLHATEGCLLRLGKHCVARTVPEITEHDIRVGESRVSLGICGIELGRSAKVFNR